jgi:hypothetical protein
VETLLPILSLAAAYLAGVATTVWIYRCWRRRTMANLQVDIALMEAEEAMLRAELGLPPREDLP